MEIFGFPPLLSSTNKEGENISDYLKFNSTQSCICMTMWSGNTKLLKQGMAGGAGEASRVYLFRLQTLSFFPFFFPGFQQSANCARVGSAKCAFENRKNYGATENVSCQCHFQKGGGVSDSHPHAPTHSSTPGGKMARGETGECAKNVRL